MPIFHRGADLSATPNTCAYMLRCASMPSFGEAFGEGHQQLVIDMATQWLQSDSSGRGGGSFLDKMFQK